MKRNFILFCLLSLVWVIAIGARWYSHGSGETTSNKVIVNEKCYITGILIITDGTNDAKLILYDNNIASTSATVMYETTVTGGDEYGGRIWSYPMLFNKGIYAVVSGTGASYIIEYIKHSESY